MTILTLFTRMTMTLRERSHHQARSLLALALIVGSPISKALPAAIAVENAFAPPAVQLPSVGGIVAADFDADGRSDAALVEYAATASQDDGSYSIDIYGASGATSQMRRKAQVLMPYSSEVHFPPARMLLVPAQTPMLPQLVLVDAGTAYVVGGWPPTIQRSFPVASNQFAAALGDVESNGTMQLVISTRNGPSSSIHAYKLADGTPLWSLNFVAATDLNLLQLDQDAALEIVAVTENLVTVYDGATRAIQGSTQPFSSDGPVLLAGGRMDNNGALDSFAAAGRAASMALAFQSPPFLPLWTLDCMCRVEMLSVADFDNFPPNELIVSSWSVAGIAKLQVYRTSDRTILHQYSWATDYGSTDKVVIADVGGDLALDLVFAKRASGPVTVLDAFTGTTVATFDTEFGPFIPALPFTGTGFATTLPANLIVSSTGGGFANSGRTRAYNLATGADQWLYSSPTFSTGDVLVAQMDADPALEIIITEPNVVSPRISILDGSTGTLERSIDQGLTGRRPDRIALLPPGPSGIPDIVAGTVSVSSGAVQGARATVYSGETGALLWESTSASPFVVKDITVANVDSDPQSEILLVGADNLTAFDSQTHATDWSLILSETLGVSVWDDAPGGRTLLIFRSNGFIDLFTASDRTLIRTIDVGNNVSAVRAVPGNSRYLLAAVDGKLRLVDSLDGTIVRESAFRGLQLGARNRIELVATSEANTWKAIAGSLAGVTVFSVPTGEPTLFQDGFE